MKYHLRLLSLLLLIIILSSTHNSANPSLSQAENSNLRIGLNMEYNEVRTGDTFKFRSEITNLSVNQTSSLVVAINIINLGDGAPVDPEDWSPRRTQSIGILNPNQAKSLTWTIYPILEGDYLIYLVVIPKPSEVDETSTPLSSQAIHLTVDLYVRINPQGILPMIIGIPILLALSYFGMFQLNKRRFENPQEESSGQGVI